MRQTCCAYLATLDSWLWGHVAVHTWMCVQKLLISILCVGVKMLPVLCSQPPLVLPGLSSPHLQKINPFSSSIFFLKYSLWICPLTWPLSGCIPRLIPLLLAPGSSSAFIWFNYTAFGLDICLNIPGRALLRCCSQSSHDLHIVFFPMLLLTSLPGGI